MIPSYVEGYKIPLVEIPFQNYCPPPVSMKEELKMIVQENIEEMLKKESDSSSVKQARTVCKHNFDISKEIFRISTSNKFEEPKLLCWV